MSYYRKAKPHLMEMDLKGRYIGNIVIWPYIYIPALYHGITMILERRPTEI